MLLNIISSTPRFISAPPPAKRASEGEGNAPSKKPRTEHKPATENKRDYKSDGDKHRPRDSYSSNNMNDSSHRRSYNDSSHTNTHHRENRGDAPRRDAPPIRDAPKRDNPPRDAPTNGAPPRDAPRRDGPALRRDGQPFRNARGPALRRDGQPFRNAPRRDGPPPNRDAPPRRTGPSLTDGTVRKDGYVRRETPQTNYHKPVLASLPEGVSPPEGAEVPRVEEERPYYKPHYMHHTVNVPQTMSDLPELEKRTARLLSDADANKVGSGFSAIGSGTITFKSAGLPEKLVTHLEASGYTKPTSIQAESIPTLVNVRDALIKSQTGSGKTLAYLLPVLRHLGELPVRLARNEGTKAIILAPTRELAVQIENVYRIVSKPYYWLIASTIMGGENKKAEKSRLRKGIHIVIGTPGRVLDHIESTQCWNLSRVRWFILDEADRLMDLGFEDTLRSIFNHINNLTNKNRLDERQRNILVSATLTKGSAVERLAGEIMKNPIYIGFGDEDEEENKSGDTNTKVADIEILSTTTQKEENKTEVESTSDTNQTVKCTVGAPKSASTPAATTITTPTTSITPAAPVTGDMKDTTTAEEETKVTVHQTPSSLEQLYIAINTRQRLVALASFLRLRISSAQYTNSKAKIIVFVSTCAEVEFLHKIFTHTFWPDHESDNPIDVKEDDVVEKAKTEEERQQDQARRLQDLKKVMDASVGAKQPRIPLLDTQLWKLHGNMLQKTRTTTYFEFSKASEGILFCTDVAARGLDLPAVDWIVQYDPPEDTEDYIHRVGRTARIGHEGKAIIFLNDTELEYLTVLRRHGITLTPYSLERALGGLHIGIKRTIARNETTRQAPAGAILQKQLEAMVTISPGLGNLAKEAYVSYLRSYAAYPKSLKLIFHPKKLHLGQVAHSFALSEKPSMVSKKAAETHQQTESTINTRGGRHTAPKFAKGPAKQESLHQLAKKQGKKGDVSEFM